MSDDLMTRLSIYSRRGFLGTLTAGTAAMMASLLEAHGRCLPHCPSPLIAWSCCCLCAPPGGGCYGSCACEWAWGCCGAPGQTYVMNCAECYHEDYANCDSTCPPGVQSCAQMQGVPCPPLP